MDALLKSRSRAKAAITRIQTWVASNKGKEPNVNAFTLRFDSLRGQIDAYSEIQDQIEDLDVDEKDTENRQDIEDKCFSILAELRSEIDRLNAPNSEIIETISVASSSRLPKQHVKLPIISIPTFSGNITNWTSFIELFGALIIEDNGLSNIEKFMYLKTYLSGEALKLIEGLELTNDNFEVALNILKDRFENKLFIINTHLNFILDYPKITKCTSQILRDFLTQCKSNIVALEVVKCPVESWDLILINILSRKLDFASKRAYEEERQRNSDNFPTLKEFFEILGRRCSVLETMHSADSFSSKGSEVKPKYPPKTTLLGSVRVDSEPNSNHKNYNKSRNFSDNKAICLFCKQTTHRIYTCFQFKNLNSNEKSQFVSSNQLCFNCLGNKHNANRCPSSQCCRVCFKKHHTLLHVDQSNFIKNKTDFATPNRNSQQNCSPLTNSQRASGTSPKNQNESNNTDFPFFTANYSGQRQEVSQLSDSHVDHLSQLQSDNTLSSVTNFSSNHSQVLLATGLVTFYSKENKPIQARILFDNGSQTNFITQSLVDKLKLTPHNVNLNIVGIGQNVTVSQQMVNLLISSKVNNRHFDVPCAILNNITCKLPQIPIDFKKLRIPPGLDLADPTFFDPSDIDILLNASVYSDMLCEGFIRLGKNLPILQKTHLGWIVVGNIPPEFTRKSSSNQALNVSLHSQAILGKDNLDSLLSKFWTIEEVSTEKCLSPEDTLAEEIFQSSFKLLGDGSVQVDIPLKGPQEFEKLGDTFSIALKRFENLEKRFRKDPQLFQKYSQFIQEYVALGHAHYVPLTLKTPDNNPKYFLPHHCVVREESVSTKLRVVFDASCKSSTGYSLNDLCLKGYQVQPELYDILCSFRTFSYVLTADIEKMFRQIRVNPAHALLQNILWRDSPDMSLKNIQLDTVTYGTNCAPFLASRTLHEIATQNNSLYPLASDALLSHTYMDDILYSCNDLIQLQIAYSQLTQLLKGYNFHLHKWNSNSPEFLKKICVDLQNSDELLTFDNSANKVLGLSWHSRSDTLSISFPHCTPDIKQGRTTKRKMLSLLAQMFDPLGLIGPVIVVGKMLMQSLWLEKINWDTELSPLRADEWKSFFEDALNLSQLKVPRHLFLKKEITTLYAHGFADASLKAYGACVYFKADYSDGTTSCNLITSKSRIAPIKTVSLPRLELCAMVLLSNLVKRVIDIYSQQIPINFVYLWTDSEIALCWVGSHASRWSVFVSNRVSQIQHLTEKYQWNHVDSRNNPADLLSRGSTVQKIQESSLWWNGPPFLHKFGFDLSSVSTKKKNLQNSNIPEERKVSMIVAPLKKNPHEVFWNSILNKYSSFSRLQRVIAFVFRFATNLKSHSDQAVTGPLTVDELARAEATVIKTLQELYFATELKELKQNKILSNKNLRSLNPFINKNGYLCVGGRLKNADVPEAQENPILLPSKCPLVSLMLKREHIRLMHGGAQTVLSNIRLRYWPLNGLREIKKVIRQCLSCYRLQARPAQQQMADLPLNRVTSSHPFREVGVDFAGPFLIKSSPLRKAPTQKVYIALFICMATKAVHLEVVSSLDTAHFIMTLKRFIARRGLPSVILSDNATNFLGARNELKEIYDFFKLHNKLNSIKGFLADTQVKWKFIPPRSPHWGGLWESHIKSAKYHMKRIIGLSTFTYEQFVTVITQIESILNSRPLCPLSNDPSDLGSLTPGHFLVGRSLISLPDKDVCEVPQNRLKFYQRVTQIQQQFWRRWSVEYLNMLQKRPKWLLPQRNLEVGDLVLVKNDLTTPLKWPLARIIEVFPGQDKKVRVVNLKTSNGEFTRSIAKVCPLPKID